MAIYMSYHTETNSTEDNSKHTIVLKVLSNLELGGPVQPEP